jgi:hypothetical protein
MGDKADEALKAIKALETRFATFEKQVDSKLAALETQLKNKKDMKPEHEVALKAALKQGAEQAAMFKDLATKSMLDARLKVVEAQVQAALGMAQAAAAKK